MNGLLWPSIIRFFYFFIFWFLQSDTIQIKHNIPSKLEPGSTTPVEIRIKITGVSDFAKFNFDLPEGITITEKESAGANFSQQGNIAKWVWQSIPRTDEIILKCLLKCSSGMSGVYTISGKFSYIVNNEKKTVEMDPHSVQIGEGTGKEVTQTETPVPPGQEKNEDTKVSSLADTVAGGKIQSEGAPVPERKVEEISANEFKVMISIRKGRHIAGFFKFSDNLPDNMNARALQTDGASFSIADGRVKFVWVSVPNKEILNISYILNGPPSEEAFLQGEVVYLENDQSKKVLLPRWTWKELPAKTEPSPVINEPTTVKESKEKEKEQENKEPVVSSGKQEKESPVESRNGNVVFRVQVGAFQTPRLSPSQFARERKLPQTPQTEMADGFTKFIIGRFSQYKQARDRREHFRTTVPSAFVVAYNGPSRITVQEALMLTNQQWFR